jgi:hypothetical protein
MADNVTTKPHAEGLLQPVGRRGFLTVVSLSALAPFISMPAWAGPIDAATGTVAATRAPKVRPMSVGYVDGSDSLETLDAMIAQLTAPPGTIRKRHAPPPLNVRPAADLEVGDASLMGRPLRVRVLGLYPTAAPANRNPLDLPAAIDLDFVFPPPGPWVTEAMTFQAWSFRTSPGWSPSPPVRFHLPLDWQVPPALAMKVTTRTGATSLFRADFALDVEAGRPKLRQGIYLLGLKASAWSVGRSTAQLTPAKASILMVVAPDPAST